MSCDGATNEFHLNIKRGATVTLTVTYPAVLTGYNARMIGRSTYDESTPRFSLSSPSLGIAVSGGTAATTAVATLSSTATGALTMGETGVFDFEFFDTSSPPIVKECLKKGTFEVVPNSNAAP